GEIPDVGKAFPLQQACRQTRAVSGRAINKQRTLAVEFTQAFLQMWEKNVLRTGDAAILPFSRPADIEQLQTISRVLQFVNGHLRQLAQRITGILPRSHPADQVAGELGVTSADKKRRYFFSVSIAFE